MGGSKEGSKERKKERRKDSEEVGEAVKTFLSVYFFMFLFIIFEIIIYWPHLSFPFPPFLFSHYTSPCILPKSLFMFHQLLFIHQWIYTCIYIPKYKLPSPYNVTCMHVLGDKYLALYNKLVCRSWRKPTFLFSSVACSSYVGLRVHGLFPMKRGIILVQLTFGQ